MKARLIGHKSKNMIVALLSSIFMGLILPPPSLAQDAPMPDRYCSKVPLFPYTQRFDSNRLKDLWASRFLEDRTWSSSNFLVSGTALERRRPHYLAPVSLVSQYQQILIYRDKSRLVEWNTYLEKDNLGIWIHGIKDLSRTTLQVYVCRDLDEQGVPVRSLEGIESLINRAFNEVDAMELQVNPSLSIQNQVPALVSPESSMIASMNLDEARSYLQANWSRLNTQEKRMVIGTASVAVLGLATATASRVVPVLRSAIARARTPEMAVARVAATRTGIRFATIVATLGVGTMSALAAPLDAAMLSGSVPQGMNTVEWFFTDEGVQRIATYNDRSFNVFIRGDLLQAWVIQLAEALQLLR